MALRNQPYIPLYIQDIMTDEKLNECSASTHGIYIKGIMCLMHKSEEYGKILLKQKYKQNGSKYKNFACQLAKNLLYTEKEIEVALEELIREGVCYFDDDSLCQKRMIRDNEISLKRSVSGKIGGEKTKNNNTISTKKQNNFALAKSEANSEYENTNEYVIEIKNDIVNRVENFKLEVGLYSYPEKTLSDFFNYWSELNKSKTKMRWEMEKTWDIKKRLDRWANSSFNKSEPKNKAQDKIEKLIDTFSNVKRTTTN